MLYSTILHVYHSTGRAVLQSAHSAQPHCSTWASTAALLTAFRLLLLYSTLPTLPTLPPRSAFLSISVSVFIFTFQRASALLARAHPFAPSSTSSFHASSSLLRLYQLAAHYIERIFLRT